MRSLKSLLLEKIEKVHVRPVAWLTSTIEVNSFRSYSAYGEDAVIEGFLSRHQFVTKEVLNLSFIDIGAWKPIRESNTYQSYKSGNYGTAVEPNPYLQFQWQALRPKDQFLSIACSDRPFETLHVFHPNGSSNTLSEEFANGITKSQEVAVTETLNVKCLSLSEIIRCHKEVFPGPYFLDIDVEGFDLKVLSTYRFDENRPVLVLIEDTCEFLASPIHAYLENVSYKLVGRTAITSFYVDLTHTLSGSLVTS